ncbi:MAG: hypothetical protein RI842_07330 [Schleiferiaceae bacterium]|nr:hypothetical protein [Schleiferiaceae bacterium]MDR9442516.1 hypothetical protein [Schleiferiaceae bacterium]
MLNISGISIAHRIDLRKYSSLHSFKDENETWRRPKQLLLIFGVVCLLLSFLPRTQKIKANGQVTSRPPSNKAQDLQLVINGRIEKWPVVEGDFIEKGVTLLTLSKVMDNYLAPQLLVGTPEQTKAKKAPRKKAKALDDQIQARVQARKLKPPQAKNKRCMSGVNKVSCSLSNDYVGCMLVALNQRDY